LYLRVGAVIITLFLSVMLKKEKVKTKKGGAEFTMSEDATNLKI
jgi:hypothetical protein